VGGNKSPREGPSHRTSGPPELAIILLLGLSSVRVLTAVPRVEALPAERKKG
jgi:hypothetical protein